MSHRESLVVVDRYLTHIAWNRHRKTACRVEFTEQDVSKSVTSLLSGIELGQKGIHILACPSLVERPSFDIDHHHRRSCLLHCLEEIVLESQERKACTVEAFSGLHVAYRILVGDGRSCLLVCGLEVPCAGSSDNHNGNVGPSCRTHRFRNGIVLRVTDRASLHICHVLFAYLGLYAVKNGADVLTWLRSRIVSELVVHVVGIRSDYGHLHVLAERKYTVVFEKHDAFAGSLTCHGNILGFPHLSRCGVRIYIRIVKESELELQLEDSSDSLVQNL